MTKRQSSGKRVAEFDVFGGIENQENDPVKQHLSFETPKIKQLTQKKAAAAQGNRYFLRSSPHILRSDYQALPWTIDTKGLNCW